VAFYNKLGVKQGGKWGKFFESEIISIDQMDIRGIDKNIITIYIEYRWKHQFKSSDTDGVATLEWTDSSYKILKLKTAGMTYRTK
jgi:hypothetical protein